MDPAPGNPQWPNVAPSPQQQQQQQPGFQPPHGNGQGSASSFQQQQHQQQQQFQQQLQQQLFDQQQAGGSGQHYAQQQQQQQQQPSQSLHHQFSGIPAHLLQGLAGHSSSRTSSPQSLSQLQLLQATQQYQQQQQLQQQQQQQQQLGGPGQGGYSFNPQQAQQRPPSSASTARPRQASSSSNAGAFPPGSPALSHASVPSPATQARPSPMIMGSNSLVSHGQGNVNGSGGSVDPSALLGRGSPNGIDRGLNNASRMSGDFSGQFHQQQQMGGPTSMTPDSLARQQQMMAAALKSRNSQFPQQQFDASGNPQQQPGRMSQSPSSLQGSSFSQLPSAYQQPQSNQSPQQRQHQRHQQLPPPHPSSTPTPGSQRNSIPFLGPQGLPNTDPSLPPFMSLDQLPSQFHPWANHPAALQYLTQKNPGFISIVASKMAELGRGAEGLPGLPGTTGKGRGSFSAPTPPPVPPSQQLPSVQQQNPSPWPAQPQQPQQQQQQPSQPQQQPYQTPRQPSQPQQLPQVSLSGTAQDMPDRRPTPNGAPPSRAASAQARRESNEQAQASGWPQVTPASVGPTTTDGRPGSRSSLDLLRPQADSPSHGGNMQPPPRNPTSASPHPLPPPVKAESSPTPLPLLAPPLTGTSTPTTSVAPTATLTPTATEVSTLSEHQLANVRLWKARDEAYVQAAEKDQKRQAAQVNSLRTQPGGVVRPNWWEVEGPEAKRRRDPQEEQRNLGFEWPSVKKSKWESRLKRTQIKFSRNQVRQAAKVDEHLIPIRLEIDSDPFRFRDTFTWNALEPVVTPELFAQTLVEDFHLPQALVERIAASIREQVSAYQSMASVATLPPVGKQSLTDSEDQWWSRWRDSIDRARRLRKGKGRERDLAPELDGEGPMTLDDLARAAGKAVAVDDMRIIIKLDITVGTLNLTDAFEWDITETDAAAEQFAEIYAADLGLAGEFKTAIAHDIREQSQTYLRSLVLVGHPFDGTPVLDDDLRVAFLPPVGSVVRTEDVANANFTPMFEKLDEAMIERREKEREKELKRKKRQTKGRRGVALPDREPKPSKRSVPSLGGVDANGVPIPAPDAPGVESVADEAPPPSLRRAAAVAASASITQHAVEDNQRSPPPSRSVTPEPEMYRRPPPKSQTPVVASSKLPSPAPPSPAPSSPPPTPARSHRAKGKPLRSKPASKASSRHETPRASIRGASTPMPTDVKQEDADHEMDDRSPSKSPQPSKASSRATSPRKSTRLSPVKPETPAEANGLKKAGDNGPTPVRTADGSPLSFHDVASPDSLSSLSDGEDTLSDFARVQQKSPPAAAPPPPDAAPSMPPPPSSTSPGLSRTSATPAPAVADAPAPPEWISNAAAELRAKYRDDRFQVIPKLKKGPGASASDPPDWRIKCNDCPGRIYDPGQGPHLDNFIVHLNNRNHRTNVSNRLIQESGGSKE